MKKLAVLFTSIALCLATTSSVAQIHPTASFSIEDVDDISSACEIVEASSIVLDGMNAKLTDMMRLVAEVKRLETDMKRLETELNEWGPVFSRIGERGKELNVTDEDMENCYNYQYMMTQLEALKELGERANRLKK